MRVLDLESEVMRDPGSNIFHWIFWFSRSKASVANIGIFAIFVHFEKTLVFRQTDLLLLFLLFQLSVYSQRWYNPRFFWVLRGIGVNQKE